VNPQGTRHASKTKASPVQRDPFEFSKPEAIEPPFSLEAREAWRASGPQSPKERVVRLIESLKRASLQAYRL
jgi:hypothetical protein